MKLGIMFPRFPAPCTIEDSARFIRQAGFEHATMWWYDRFLEAGYTSSTPDYPGRFEQLAVLRGEDIHVCFLHAHSDILANAFWEAGDTGDMLMQSHLRSIEECSNEGIGVIIIHVTSSGSPPDPNELGLDRIGRLTGRARELGVIVAIENLKRTEHVNFLLDRIHSPGLGFCYDSGHDFLYNPDPYAILQRNGRRLAAVHLHDNEGGHALRWPGRQPDSHAMPGEGNIDWNTVKSLLDESGYQGVRLLEVKSNTAAPGETPPDFLRRMYCAATKFL